MARKIGVIGLGAMGGNAVERLVELGHEVTVYDTRAARVGEFNACRAATSPADLAKDVEVILAFVPYSHQLEEIALGPEGIGRTARPGTIFVNMSTTAPASTKKIAAALADKGIDVVGAPMNGGPHLARAGELALVVGGSDRALASCEDVLAALGTLRHVGDVGAGEVVKIINNLLLAVATTANAEALVLGVKAGIDPDKLVDAIVNGVGANHSMKKQYQQHVLKGDFGEEGLFSVDFIRKDLALAFDLAQEMEVPLAFGQKADEMYQAAQAAGKSANYHPVVVTLLEEATGVEVRSQPKAG